MFIWKTLARELILPPNPSLLLILCGALLVWRGRRLGWTVFLVGFVSLWLLCTPLVADRLLALAERYPALDIDRPVNADAVVVLGGGGGREMAPEYKGPIAEGITLERVTFAAFLARRYSLPLAISGAPAEAVVMSQTLSRNLGLPPRWIEGKSRDTYENAQLSARILLPAGVRRILLVTNGAHEWRAVQEFTGAGFTVIPAPVGLLSGYESGIFGYVPGPAALSRSKAAVYELLGEPMRRLQAALGVREKFDRAIQAGPAAGTR